LMNWLFQTDDLNATFIHVSKWFKEHIVECDARAKAKRAYIIPNPIDETLFTYDEKNPELRKRILLIRPFASKKYANDLAVEAIRSLSDKPFFKRLEFGIFGDGKLFNQTIAPLKQFENVQIERVFLKQSEIAALHKQYGVFLCPTRWD